MCRIGKADATCIRDYLRDTIAPMENPRALGSALQGSRFAGLWRYRVGDYRIVCQIEDDRVVALVLGVGHRGSVYR